LPARAESRGLLAFYIGLTLVLTTVVLQASDVNAGFLHAVQLGIPLVVAAHLVAEPIVRFVGRRGCDTTYFVLIVLSVAMALFVVAVASFAGQLKEALTIECGLFAGVFVSELLFVEASLSQRRPLARVLIYAAAFVMAYECWIALRAIR
jgi:hypothetical protein